MHDFAEATRHQLAAGPSEVIPLFPKETEAGNRIFPHKGELFTIGAESGRGKTALAAAAANNSGVFVWHNSDWSSVAYSTTKTGTLNYVRGAV